MGVTRRTVGLGRLRLAALLALICGPLGKQVEARSVAVQRPGLSIDASDRSLWAPLGPEVGHVDWTTRQLWATGRAPGAVAAYLPPEVAPYAQRRAISAAHDALIALARRLVLGPGGPLSTAAREDPQAPANTVAAALAHDARLAPIIYACVQQSRIIRASYGSDGAVAVEAALSLDGDGDGDGGLGPLWAALLEGRDGAKATAVSLAATEDNNSDSGAGLASGIVVNARGQGFVPSIWPRIVTQSGRKVYDAASVRDDVRFLRGMMGATRSLDVAIAHERVAPLPQVISALRVPHNEPHTLIISDADGATFDLLHKEVAEARVVVVVD